MHRVSSSYLYTQFCTTQLFLLNLKCFSDDPFVVGSPQCRNSERVMRTDFILFSSVTPQNKYLHQCGDRLYCKYRRHSADKCIRYSAYNRLVEYICTGRQCFRRTGTFSWNFWTVIIRAGHLGFFLGKLEILIVALSKSTYQSQRSRVQLPAGAK